MTEPAYDLIIRGGRVATTTDTFEADVAIAGETIIAIGRGLGPARREIDARGKLVDTVSSSKHRGVNRAEWSMHLKAPKVPPAVSAAFGAAFGPRVLPGTYTVKMTKGDTTNKDALRAALKKADFKSVRGDFKFNTNHYPIQNFYLVKVAKRPDGKYQTEIVQKVFSDFADPYAADCPMK